MNYSYIFVYPQILSKKYIPMRCPSVAQSGNTKDLPEKWRRETGHIFLKLPKDSKSVESILVLRLFMFYYDIHLIGFYIIIIEGTA